MQAFLEQSLCRGRQSLFPSLGEASPLILNVTGEAAYPKFINVDIIAAGLAPFKPAAKGDKS
jgi:hypothetical protein